MTKIVNLGKKYGFYMAVAGLFVTAFLLRFYRIGVLPDILHADEAGMGYNAWSIAHYGVDRYLNEMPLYPENFGGGQSFLYTYILVLLLKLLPETALSLTFVRLPAIFSSMVVVACGAWMLQLLFRSRRITLAGMVILTFCPYFIMSGRFGWDCNLMLGCSVLAITLLIRYLQKQTWPSLLLCGAGFALILYSYAVSYIILPIFLISLTLYMLYTRKINMRRAIVWAVEIAMLGLPIILFVICLLWKLPGFQILGFQISPVASGRVEDVIKTSEAYWKDFFGCIKITLTYDISASWSAVDKFYTMYMISIPFIFIGFIWSLGSLVKTFRSRRFTCSAIFIFYAMAIIITTGWTGAMIHRANAIFICYVYFCIEGIRQTLRFMRRYRRAFVTVLCAGYAVWIAAFLRYYFTMYTVTTEMYYPYRPYVFSYLDQEAFAFMEEVSAGKTAYIDSCFKEYLYFYEPVSPYEQNSNSENIVLSYLDETTPIDRNSVYMVDNGNEMFLGRIQTAGIPYTTMKFKHHYVFVMQEE